MEALHIEKIGQLLELAGLDNLQHPLCHLLKVEDINHLPASFSVDYSLAFYSNWLD